MLAGAAFFSTFKGTLVFSVIFVLTCRILILPDQQTPDDSFLYSIVLPVAPATYNAIAVVYPGVDDFADQGRPISRKIQTLYRIGRISIYGCFYPSRNNWKLSNGELLK